MPSYPIYIRPCQHIKVNGTQCGSPAMRAEKYCYFHMRWHQKSMEINLSAPRERSQAPRLENRDPLHLGLVEVRRLLVTHQIDYRTAALVLYALRTASSNFKNSIFEQENLAHDVTHPESTLRCPLVAQKTCDEDELVDLDLPDAVEARMSERTGLLPNTPDLLDVDASRHENSSCAESL